MPGLAVTAEALDVDHAEVVPVPLLVGSFPCTVFVLILFVDFFSSLFFAAVLLAAALTALPRSLPVLPSPLSRAHSLLSLSPAINIQDGGQSTSTRADATQGRKSSQSATDDGTGPPIRARP